MKSILSRVFGAGPEKATYENSAAFDAVKREVDVVLAQSRRKEWDDLKKALSLAALKNESVTYFFMGVRFSITPIVDCPDEVIEENRREVVA